ncbi:MAG: aminomethyl-transferring glycine dehydrogenase [Actinomycetes bacterium]
MTVDPQEQNVLGDFVARHIGFTPEEQATMLAHLGFDSLDALMDAAVPQSVRSQQPLSLPPPATELGVLDEARDLAAQNDPAEPMIGLGYYGTVMPGVIRRRVLESPAWYTAYTPYQPEISQGRLEALLNFQTMVADLTGLPTSNASLLDEGTAVAEAMAIMRRSSRVKADRIVVDADVFPQSIAVLQTRCRPIGVDVVVADLTQGLPDGDFFGVVLQYPGASGAVVDQRHIVRQAQEKGALVTVAADLLALTLLSPPGEWGADVVVGTSQRFGVSLGYGGPHAGYIAVRDGLERSLPGRLVGVSVDAAGRLAYRLALQTREQHIRRDKATSNICTAQVLLAVIASMYAVYHGPEGLREIATRVHEDATSLAKRLSDGGVEVVHDAFFDTLLVRVPGRADEVVAKAATGGVQLRRVDADLVGVACAETTTADHLDVVLTACGVTGDASSSKGESRVPADLVRTSQYLTHPVFNSHHSETAMLRYLRSLSDKDYALDRGMIPLGSCTMKLNATTEMEPISFPGFADVHPFAPAECARGYMTLIDQLESWLAEVTGYAKVSIQPNAGSQGELAGLLAIQAYHASRGDGDRNVCLIPSSAHGTNAASAAMAGMRVVVIKSLEGGEIDLEDLRAKCAQHSERLAAIMVTYPSTHGVYEEGITELCDLVHEHGGQVYVDGANLNALLGIAAPGKFGGDVSHLNLHKTFCIPHGGGGPGVGPVGVAAHLVPFLPSHPMHPDPERREGVGPVSAAPFGSAGILPISWAYIRLMGASGLTQATKVAVLAANYIANRLAPYYPTLFTGASGLVAHECIVDLRTLTKETGVTVDDVAKRLIDYGFHAPTMSFPVAGTLMVEPTESEDLREIERFIEAMISIRAEIEAVVNGIYSAESSPLRSAPHTAEMLVGEWEQAYTRGEAVYPAGTSADKYWPPVRRVDQSYGDRNLVCSCPPPEAFES